MSAKKKFTEEKEPVNSVKVYKVADGKSLLTKRGILADGADISADDLPQGEKTLKVFVESGHVVAS